MLFPKGGDEKAIGEYVIDGDSSNTIWAGEQAIPEQALALMLQGYIRRGLLQGAGSTPGAGQGPYAKGLEQEAPSTQLCSTAMAL